jgi:hypothetical protein
MGYEHNECTVDKANAMGIPESTLKTIRKQAEFKESRRSAMRMAGSKIRQIWVMIMRKLERMLAQYIESKHQHAILLPTMIIQAKLKILFYNLNATEPDKKVQSSAASAG